MKFHTGITSGGCKILSINGPVGNRYVGQISYAGKVKECIWDLSGKNTLEAFSDEFNLIPLDEPKPEPSQALDRARLDYLEEQFHRLEATITLLNSQIKDVQTDAVSRVNGLRADYLADQSAVQPSRVDALEERLEYLEEKDEKTDERLTALESKERWMYDKAAKTNEAVACLQKTVEALERAHNHTDSVVKQQVNALADRTKRLEALEKSVSDLTVDKFISDNSGLMDKLAKQEELNKGAQPSEKGVWVTTRLFWDACWSEVDARGEPLEDLFARIAKRLGLEE